MRTAREVIAEAVFNAAYYVFEDGWVDPERIPDGDDPDDWDCELPQWDCATDDSRANGYRMTDAAIAALRTEGLVIVAAADVRTAMTQLPQSRGFPITGNDLTGELICLRDRLDAALAAGGTDGQS